MYQKSDITRFFYFTFIFSILISFHKGGGAPLHDAIAIGDTDRVKELLARGKRERKWIRPLIFERNSTLIF